VNANADVSALLREAEKHGCAVVPVDTFHAIVNGSERYKAQRDALLAALEAAALTFATIAVQLPEHEFAFRSHEAIARAAIAKARGEA